VLFSFIPNFFHHWIQKNLYKIFFWPLVLALFAGCSGSEIAPLFSKPVLQKMRCVYVQNIPERTGQILRQSLQNTLSSGFCEALYELKIKLTEAEQTMAFGIDARTTLAHLETKVHYQLICRSSQKCLKEGQVSAHNSYDVLSSDHQKVFANIYYSSTKAIDFAKTTNLENLKYRILEELANFFQQNSNTIPSGTRNPRTTVEQHFHTQRIK
jgi:hypothetical protein